jgi:hypothetical protein
LEDASCDNVDILTHPGLTQTFPPGFGGDAGGRHHPR